MNLSFKILASACLLTAVAACSSDKATEPTQEQPDINSNWELTTQLDLTSDEKENIDIVNDFSHKLMTEAQATSENGMFCVSPLSISVYLGMLANSTTGDVHDEIMAALGTNDINTLNSLNKKLMHYLPCDNNGSSIAVANRFWVNHAFNVPETFCSLVSDVFNAEVDYVDFTDKTTVPAINKWVSDKTDGKIPSLLDGDWEKYIALTMVSANTVYFKGNWQSMFDPEESSIESFYGLTGDSKARMMHNTLSAGYAKNSIVQIVTLDFEGANNTMELYLPAEGIDIRDITSTLSAEACTELRKSIQPYDVTLSLPSFENSAETDLPKILESMGIKSLDKADFAPMGLGNIPTKLLHKTSIRIDEKGAELAAVTGGMDILMPDKSDYPKVKVDFDRSFLYIVRNNKTGAILMAGTVM